MIACARPAPRARDTPPREEAIPASQERHYTIWLGGGRVGTAIEREDWSQAGLVLHREETLTFYRGDAIVTLATAIEIAATTALVPTRVHWTQLAAGTWQQATATRDATGEWNVSYDPQSRLPADAVPAELVPLIVRRDGKFAGRVFLPARQFLVSAARIDPVAPDRLVAQLDLGQLRFEATIDLDADRNYARVVDGEGVIALRGTPEQAAAPFQPLDLIAATAIPIEGAPSHTLVLDGSIALPPVPGQLARLAPDGGVALELSPHLPGDLPLAAQGRDRSREIAALVDQVRAQIAPDLSARPGSPHDASSATAGDCTTFALAYAALADQRAIPTRVVTGLRIDGNRLVRHRWTVSWTGRAWIAVDAAYGAAPAGGDLVGLAVHDADNAGLVSGEAALTQVRGAAWR